MLLLLLSRFSCVQLCVTPETAAHQAPRPWVSPGKNTGVGCHCLLQCMKVKSESEVAQSCPTPSDPMDCSLPRSSIHVICQARVLEWAAIAFSRHYARWDKSDREYHLHVQSPVNRESRRVVTRGSGTGEVLFKGKTCNQQTKKNPGDLWTAQCTINFKVAKRLYLNYFHHKKRNYVM